MFVACFVYSVQDMDGYVSQKDYRLAKRFDFDGNGVLDAEERQVGKRVLAEVRARADCAVYCLLHAFKAPSCSLRVLFFFFLLSSLNHFLSFVCVLFLIGVFQEAPARFAYIWSAGGQLNPPTKCAKSGQFVQVTTKPPLVVFFYIFI